MPNMNITHLHMLHILYVSPTTSGKKTKYLSGCSLKALFHLCLHPNKLPVSRGLSVMANVKNVRKVPGKFGCSSCSTSTKYAYKRLGLGTGWTWFLPKLGSLNKIASLEPIFGQLISLSCQDAMETPTSEVRMKAPGQDKKNKKNNFMVQKPGDGTKRDC